VKNTIFTNEMIEQSIRP